MAWFALVLAVGTEEIVGVVGGLGAATGAVAWVVRVENDLLSKYRLRVAELARDLREAETERDDWRDKYYRLVHLAASHGVPLHNLGLEEPRRRPDDPSPPQTPPILPEF